jgi:hypothetical protein
MQDHVMLKKDRVREREDHIKLSKLDQRAESSQTDLHQNKKSRIISDVSMAD